jgi:hypothetical protein
MASALRVWPVELRLCLDVLGKIEQTKREHTRHKEPSGSCPLCQKQVIASATTDALCGPRLSFSETERILSTHVETFYRSPADPTRAVKKIRCSD